MRRLPRATSRRLLALLGGLLVGLFIVEKLLGGPLRPDLDAGRDADWQTATRAMHAALHQADDALVYVPRPGASVQMAYGRAAFNAQGLREDGPVGAPGEDRRVLVLGDSLVWGELLPREAALPAALDRALGPGHEVLNLGVTGYDTAQELGWYLRTGRPLQPDVVVLVFCLNDLFVQSGPFQIHADAEARAAWAAERAAFDRQAPLRNETVNQLWWEERRGDGLQVAAALRHSLRWHRLFTMPGGYIDEVLLAARDPARIARLHSDLLALGQAIRDDGAQPVLVISPGLYWWHRYQWTEVHDAVRQGAEAAGFRVVEPLEAWRGEDPTPFRFPGDNLHYTEHGTERLAAVIATALLPGASPTPTTAAAGSTPSAR